MTTKKTEQALLSGKGLSEEELMQYTKQSLQQRAERIDGETIAELDRIRHRVIARVEKPRRQWFAQPVLGGALAACLVAAVAMFAFQAERGSTISNDSEFEMVLVNNDFEMLTEELEFYQWLEEEIGEV